MAGYALIGPTNEVERWATDREVSPNVQTRWGWRWLPVIVIDPPYNPATDLREGPFITVKADSVERVWRVRPLSAGEIAEREDAAKERKLSDVDILVFRVLFNLDSRVRVLEGLERRTAEQFRTAMKALL